MTTAMEECLTFRLLLCELRVAAGVVEVVTYAAGSSKASDLPKAGGHDDDRI